MTNIKQKYKKIIWLQYIGGVGPRHFSPKKACKDVSDFVSRNKSFCVYTKFVGNQFRLVFRDKETENLFLLIFSERMTRHYRYSQQKEYYTLII